MSSHHDAWNELERRLGPQARYGAQLAEACSFIERALRLETWLEGIADERWQALAESAAPDLREAVAGDGEELRRRGRHLAAELFRHGLALAHEARTLYDEAELRDLGDGR